MSKPKQAFHYLYYYSIVLCRIVVTRSASQISTLPGNVSGIHIFRIQPRPTESEILNVYPERCILTGLPD